MSKDIRTGFFRVELPHGGYMEYGWSEELLTLSTIGATTDSVSDLLPADADIKSVCGLVTVDLLTATAWALGDPTTAARFATANATLVVGTVSIGLNHRKGGVATDAAGPTQGAAGKVRVTCTGTPTSGQVRLQSIWERHVGPTS